MLLALARAAGHPMLTSFDDDPATPMQTADCSISSYLRRWTHHLLIQTLNGRIFSDRYFLQLFLRNMHPVLRHYFATDTESRIRDFPINMPLPGSFHPDRLYGRLLDLAKHLRKPALVVTAPRDVQRSSQAPSSSIQHELSAHLDDKKIAALQSREPRLCFLCKSDQHVCTDCPIRATLAANPEILRDLTNPRGRSSSKTIRQITDDNDTPGDVPDDASTQSGEPDDSASESTPLSDNTSSPDLNFG